MRWSPPEQNACGPSPVSTITPTVGVVARAVERLGELEERLRPEGVAHLGPVDGDLRDAVAAELVADVRVLAGGRPGHGHGAETSLPAHGLRTLAVGRRGRRARTGIAVEAPGESVRYRELLLRAVRAAGALHRRRRAAGSASPSRSSPALPSSRRCTAACCSARRPCPVDPRLADPRALRRRPRGRGGGRAPLRGETRRVPAARRRPPARTSRSSSPRPARPAGPSRSR